jgi:hypothetical protein
MRDKDTTHIHLSSNYSGACEQVPLTNENLLELTNADRFMLDGQTLFALKYRVLPCKLGLCLSCDIERFGRQKQESVYHATR